MAKKTVILKETTAKGIWKHILDESFHPERGKVLIVKKYLDDTFRRTSSDDIVDGYPKKITSVALIGTNGEALKVLEMSELLSMLEDKFIEMILDKEDRRKFLKAVIKDWYNNAITPEGLLTVNVLD